MDMCAGMAKAGIKPFFAVYSTFAQRAVDQVFQEVALQKLPVRVCMDRGGFVGGDGAVHHGFMDIAMLRSLPNVVQLAPCDEQTLQAGLAFMRDYEAGASFIRYPRDNVPNTPLQQDTPAFELGKANLVRPAKGDTPAAVVLAYGVMVNTALAALPELEQQGYDVAIYDARFAMPIDIKLVRSLIEQRIPIVTVEAHALEGGFGSILLDACNREGLPTDQIKRLGMPKQWVGPDSRGNQLLEAGLTPDRIAAAVRELLDERDASPVVAPDVLPTPK